LAWFCFETERLGLAALGRSTPEAAVHGEVVDAGTVVVRSGRRGELAERPERTRRRSRGDGWMGKEINGRQLRFLSSRTTGRREAARERW
jgi:hypothetical protein